MLIIYQLNSNKKFLYKNLKLVKNLIELESWMTRDEIDNLLRKLPFSPVQTIITDIRVTLNKKIPK